MRPILFRNFIVRFISLTLLSLGLAQTSGAAMIGTQQVVQSEIRDGRLTRVETILAREDVVRQLVAFGVDPLAVQSRVGNMTGAELLVLEGKLDQQIAGGSGALVVIGVVFVVLIILEVVGVIDVFKRV